MIIHNSNATPQEILNLCAAARAEHKGILVKGYKTSKGAVMDYGFLPLPRGGYGALVKLSDSLLTADDKEHTLDREGFDADTWKQAVMDKRASFAMSMQTIPADGDSGVKSKHTLTRHDANVFESTSEPGTVVIAHLGAFAETVVSSEEKKASGRPRDPVVVCKEHIDKQLPIDEYLGQLVLAKDKYESIELCAPGEDSWTWKLFYKGAQ